MNKGNFYAVLGPKMPWWALWHNETLKEVKKANIHNGTKKKEDESPEEEGEIKEEEGLKVEFFPYVHKKKQTSKSNEEEKSDKSKFVM